MTIAAPPAIAHVREVPELAQVPADSLQALQQLGVVRTLQDGQTLQLYGDEVGHVALVLSGLLMVGSTDQAGRSQIVLPIGAGQFFNLLPVFDGGPALHEAHASGSAVLMLFEARAFLQLVRADRALHEAFLQIIFYRNRLLYAELNAIALMPMRQRCARVLLHILQTTQSTQPATAQAAREIRVSQTELAQMLGYARPAINRELQRLAREGVLDLNYLRIRITDMEALRRIAERA